MERGQWNASMGGPLFFHENRSHFDSNGEGKHVLSLVSDKDRHDGDLSAVAVKMKRKKWNFIIMKSHSPFVSSRILWLNGNVKKHNFYH